MRNRRMGPACSVLALAGASFRARVVRLRADSDARKEEGEEEGRKGSLGGCGARLHQSARSCRHARIKPRATRSRHRVRSRHSRQAVFPHALLHARLPEEDRPRSCPIVRQETAQLRQMSKPRWILPFFSPLRIFSCNLFAVVYAVAECIFSFLSQGYARVSIESFGWESIEGCSRENLETGIYKATCNPVTSSTILPVRGG